MAAVALAAAPLLWSGESAQADPPPVSFTALDQDHNGLYEVMLVSTDASPDTEVWVYDDDQNGYFERWVVDTNGDGGMDTFVTDTNQDGVFDSMLVDANLNNLDDRIEAGSMVIGPPTNLDPTVALIIQLAGETGTPVYGAPDSDHDGWNDNQDYSPSDPWRH